MLSAPILYKIIDHTNFCIQANYSFYIIKLNNIYHMNRHSWQEKEDQAIKILVDEYGKNDWTKISIKLLETCSLQRSGKQCRQRWYNHLDPLVNKRQWTTQQQNLLFQKHRQLGNKWKQISKQLVGRTDNDIKNHFYSTLRRSLRRLNKTMGQKNSTSQMRQIKPSVLSTIMSIIYNQESQNPTLDEELNNKLKDLPLLIFEFSSIKPVKNRVNASDFEFRQKISEIFQLINQFNLEYQLDKSSRKANCFIKILEKDLRRQFQPVVLAKQKSKRAQKKIQVQVKQEQIQGTALPDIAQVFQDQIKQFIIEIMQLCNQQNNVNNNLIYHSDQFRQNIDSSGEVNKIYMMEQNNKDEILSTMFQKQNHVQVQPNHNQECYYPEQQLRSRRISLEAEQIQLQMNFADYDDPSSLPQQSNFSDLIIIGKQCKRQEVEQYSHNQQIEQNQEIMDQVLEINYEQH